LTLFRQTGWIGVDIGTHGVKLAQVVRAGDAVRLSHAAVIQRPEPWLDGDELGTSKPNTSVTEIYAALHCDRFAGRNAAAVLPMNVCQFRGANVPPGNDRERRSMIVSELAEEWGDQPHPMEFDFWEVDASDGSPPADGFNVGVLAVARQWISQLVRDFQKSNLYCWAIDGTPLTMARAVGMVARGGAKRRVLAIDWGFSSTTLCIVGENRPLYARRVQHCALRRLLDAVGSAMGVTLDQARHLVDTQGVVAPGDSSGVNEQLQRAITSAASETIDELVSQIRRTLQFVALQRSLDPSACWLMGGGASIRNIGPYLSDALAMPVHIWHLPSNGAQLPCTAGNRSAVFSGAAALSALAWEAA
jgi:type IV pilus assembly protein PilM